MNLRYGGQIRLEGGGSELFCRQGHLAQSHCLVIETVSAIRVQPIVTEFLAGHLERVWGRMVGTYVMRRGN